MTRVIAYLALGSNLEDPVAQVTAACAALATLPQSTLRACSSLYRTAPVGYADQPDFINAVAAVDTTLSADALLEALLAIEVRHGRERPHPGAARTLDLDLLLYATQVVAKPALVVPHPRLHERRFVLEPLAEIAPGIDVPGRGPVAPLLARCREQAVERIA